MKPIKNSELKAIFWWAISSFCLLCLFESIFSENTTNKKNSENISVSLDVDSTKLPFEFNQSSVYYMICIAGIKHPEIVLRQAICETGHFKSNVLKKNNNLFGFHNGKRYLKFETPFECCLYYRKWQQEHYNGGDYYKFLDSYGYAADSCYIGTLKKIKINV